MQRIRKPKLVLLDRDGVINQDSADFIKSADEWIALPGALESIAALQRHVPVAVVTNQSGIARGLLDLAGLDRIHAKMNQQLQALGGKALPVFFCPHGPDDRCPCRKPAPGLIDTALTYFRVEPQEALLIGDAPRDIQAAQKAGVPAVGVGGSLQQTSSAPNTTSGDLPQYADLASAVSALQHQFEPR